MKQFDFIKDPDTKGSDSITVEHTPKRKLNLFPRIICILVALGIWIYMFNMNEDDITTEIELQIEIVGTDVLEEKGMMFYGFEQNTVIIKVQGTNRDLKQYQASDYKATVDVSGIIDKTVNNLAIKIENPVNLTVVDRSITSVGIIFDYVQEAEISDFEIVLSAASAAGLSGELNLENIPVVGAKELVDKIAYVEIVIGGDVKDGDNITYSEIASSIRYYDAKGNEIVSKGGVSIDTEKLKEIGETLTVRIVEEASDESSESGDGVESESTEASE